LFGRRPQISLRNKIVFVTGGSRGLGLLLAQEFARRGGERCWRRFPNGQAVFIEHIAFVDYELNERAAQENNLIL
jgi:NAD(P)-dependent dehydrogenase (short-subunit alcohol dehydrogenase family)